MLNSFEQFREERTKNAVFPTDAMELTFQMTADCNFRCTYCYEVKKHKSMPLDDALHVIDMLFPVEDHLDYWGDFFLGDKTKNYIGFNFFGGECLLEINNMDKICSYYWKKCMEDPVRYRTRLTSFAFTIQTNGALLDTPKVKKFLDKWKGRADLFVTIDGSKKFHDACRIWKDSGKGTYDVVRKNIEMIKERYGFLPTTKGTISPDNLPYLYDSFCGYRDLGYEYITCTIRNDCQWTEKDIQTAKEQYKLIMEDLLKDPTDKYHWGQWNTYYDEFKTSRRFWMCGSCYCNGTGCCLSYDSKIYLCFNFSPLSIPEYLGRGDLAIGNVKDGITNYDLIEKIRHMGDETVFSDSKCKGCLASSGCEFCLATSLVLSGDVNKDPKYACPIKKIEQYYGVLYGYYRKKIYGSVRGNPVLTTTEEVGNSAN